MFTSIKLRVACWLRRQGDQELFADNVALATALRDKQVEAGAYKQAYSMALKCLGELGGTLNAIALQGPVVLSPELRSLGATLGPPRMDEDDEGTLTIAPGDAVDTDPPQHDPEDDLCGGCNKQNCEGGNCH